jgi:hypothetical protein
MSTDWSMLMMSGFAAAMRSSRPPLPLMYRMMGSWGCVCFTLSITCAAAAAAV